jgi:hypothetical protein
VRLNAYVLLGDPAYLASSIRSYYHLVSRIVISYDEKHLSWAGKPLPIDDCLAELSDADPDHKFDFQPGSFSRPDISGVDAETFHRQAAHKAAGTDAEWVLQLDTDEVLAAPQTFSETLDAADAAGSAGMDYPSRWLYARLADGSYLESSSRFWRPVASYPAPLAIRSNAQIWNARRCEGDLFRVDFRWSNTDPWRRGHSLPIHAKVAVDEAVLHFSWVRTDEEMTRKSEMSPHRDADWKIEKWRDQRRHPMLTVATTPLRRRGELHPQWFRRARIPVDPPARVALT